MIFTYFHTFMGQLFEIKGVYHWGQNTISAAQLFLQTVNTEGTEDNNNNTKSRIRKPTVAGQGPKFVLLLTSCYNPVTKTQVRVESQVPSVWVQVTKEESESSLYYLSPSHEGWFLL